MSNENPGQALLDALRRELVTALHDAAAEVLPSLAGLAVDPAFAGTPYDGMVLGKPDVAHPVLTALGLLTVDQPPVSMTLHGWRDTADDAAPRGIAYVATGPSGAVVALSVVPDVGPRLTLRASGLTGGSILDAPVAGGFSLSVAGQTADRVEVAFTADAPPEVVTLQPDARVELVLTRPDPGSRLGPESGPSVLFGTVHAHLWAGGDAAGGFDGGGGLTLAGGEVVLTPDFLANLLPIPTHFPLALDVQVEPGTGVTFGGSPALSLRLTGSDGHWLDVVGSLAEGASPGLLLGFRTALTVALPGAPVELDVAGLGFDLPLALDLGTPLLPDPARLLPALPSQIGAALDLPVLSGSGFLAHQGFDLVGGLSVRIPPMAVSAYAVLSPEHDDLPLSLLAILSATFPPPGVQIGFGFAITGVGGIVGVNRRVDRDALVRAVTDGTAAQVLFPSDPAEGARAAGALPAMFPPARGSVVAGPMFQIGWGGRIVELSVAVLVEVAHSVRITMIGKLVVAVPDPLAPLIYLQATFAGFIDPAEPSVMFVASLTGSHVVGASLSGDLLVLTRGGSDPAMVISAGGFHPSYRPPRGVPQLNRMQLDLSPSPLLQMRCDGYFALTSNTLQFGAELELVAEVAGCGLRGWFGFDALVQYSPFRFQADVSGGVALRAFGETLMGVALALHLEGPAPYLARGRGSIDLFFFDVCFDFEIGWGSPAGQVTVRDVAGELRRALADPAAWRSRAATCPGVQLTEAGTGRAQAGVAVDPYGTVSVDQTLVPLGIEIQEYAGIPVPPQRYDVVGGAFRFDDVTGQAVEPADRIDPLRRDFAPGLYLTPRSDDEALAGPAFVSLGSGAQLFPQPAAGAQARDVDQSWDESVLARDLRRPVKVSIGALGDLLALEQLTLALAVDEQQWWVEPSETVVVAAQPPVATATAWSMALTDTAVGSVVEADQLVAASGTLLMTVEQWEL